MVEQGVWETEVP